MSSRVSLRAALVAAVISLMASALTMSSAMAEKATAAELEAKIVQTRQQINALYMQAAAANERVNGANIELAEAESALAKHQAVLKSADAEFSAQRDVVEKMTVQQQLYGSTNQAMMSLLTGGDADQILEEATGLKAIDEAMTAELDRLDAGRTVLDAASAAVEKVVEQRASAVARRTAARDQISAAIRRAEALEASMAAERDDIIRQLAAAQGKSVEQVEQEVADLEEQVDRGELPALADPAPTPAPTTPKPAPTTAAPTTPAPTTPAPTPTKTPDPEPEPVPDPPASSNAVVEKAIAYAQAQLGEPYAWGGAGPSKWDCSGLVMRAFGSAGISLAHYAPSQYKAGTRVSVSKIQRGDLLFWSDGSVSSIYHVAIYLGNGKMIHAPRPGRGVEIVSISYWIKPDMAARLG